MERAVRNPASPSRHGYNRYYRLDDETVLAALQSKASSLRGSLLDLGCGDSPYRELVSPYVTRYLGCDPVAQSRPNVVADGAGLPFRSGSFDSVLCTQVLEHVPDPLAVVKEIARVLRPGGVALITTPLNSGIHLAPHDYSRLTEFGLRHLSELAGLKVEALEERGGRIASAAQAVLLVFEVDRMPSRHLGAALMRRAIRLLCFAIERWALPLDRRFRKEGNPLGYLLLAGKPHPPPS